MPTRLRMNVANPGVDKTDFELWSLAVSAINGCGTRIDVNEKALKAANAPAAMIETAARRAAIIQSVALALKPAAVDMPTAAA
jgi:lipoyl-dependent peroxiredoxin subunit D